MEQTTQHTGKVVAVIGPVIDVEFEGHLPAIYNALRVVSDGAETGGTRIDVIAEFHASDSGQSV